MSAKLAWDDAAKILLYAIGGFSIFGAGALAFKIQEKTIGRQLIVPTENVHKLESLRCLLTDLQHLVYEQHSVVYLRILFQMDALVTRHFLVKQSPKCLDAAFSCQTEQMYETLVDIHIKRLFEEFSMKPNQKQEDIAKLNVLLKNISQTMYECVVSTISMASAYVQIPICYARDVAANTKKT